MLTAALGLGGCAPAEIGPRSGPVEIAVPAPRVAAPLPEPLLGPDPSPLAAAIAARVPWDPATQILIVGEYHSSGVTPELVWAFARGQAATCVFLETPVPFQWMFDAGRPASPDPRRRELFYRLWDAGVDQVAYDDGGDYRPEQRVWHPWNRPPPDWQWADLMRRDHGMAVNIAGWRGVGCARAVVLVGLSHLRPHPADWGWSLGTWLREAHGESVVEVVVYEPWPTPDRLEIDRITPTRDGYDVVLHEPGAPPLDGRWAPSAR